MYRIVQKMNRDGRPIMSDFRKKRRARLVQSAKDVFIAQGFRGATMEGIAEAASVSKATLYSYFPDKPAIFDAAASAVAEELRAVVMAELDKPVPALDAATAALIAKHRYVQTLVRASAFAEDLFRTKDAISAAHFQCVDAEILSRVAHKLSDICADPQESAELLIAASQGIANAAPTHDHLKDRINRLRVLVTPPAPKEAS